MQNVSNNVFTYGQKTGWGSAALEFQSNSSLLSHKSACLPSGK
jgi:hypothetical protein